MELEIQSREEYTRRLGQIGQNISDAIAAMAPEDFARSSGDLWSAAGYVKHLVLSVKPFAKALSLPPDQLRELFGKPDHASRSYEEIVALYTARLAEGTRAEDNPPVVPATYRMPEGISDEQAYLLNVWGDTTRRLLTAINKWQETDLDAYQLPHPAIGLLTLREMLSFTLHHNTSHWQDIVRAGTAAEKAGRI
jgi:uncharacterized damage-inducible protein DinB